MPAKRSLDQMLSGDAPQPTIRRGQGLRLSTESGQSTEEQPQGLGVEDARASAPTQDRESTKTHQRTNAKAEPRRVNRGYKLREDLVKACKRIALEEDRLLYEVMEEALEQYITRKAQQDVRS